MKFKIQAMKFSQLVEYSMRNIFLEKKHEVEKLSQTLS